jgi:hypothetical protein
MVLLETLSPSAVASVSSSAIFTGTYANYMIVARLSMNTANASLTMRWRAAGADNSTANYGGVVAHHTAGAAFASASVGTASTSHMIYVAGGAGVTWTDIALDMLVNSPQTADETLCRFGASIRVSASDVRSIWGTGVFNATTQFDAFTIIASAGTITGTIKIYGLRDA